MRKLSFLCFSFDIITISPQMAWSYYAYDACMYIVWIGIWLAVSFLLKVDTKVALILFLMPFFPPIRPVSDLGDHAVMSNKLSMFCTQFTYFFTTVLIEDPSLVSNLYFTILLVS